jgi:hypothetical protein
LTKLGKCDTLVSILFSYEIMSDNSEAQVCLAIGAMAALLVIGIGSCTLRQTTYTENVPCTIIKTENVRKGSRGENRLYCEEESFRIADDWQSGRFRSADMYGAIAGLPKGSKILLKVWGIRFGPTSSMRTAMDWSK